MHAGVPMIDQIIYRRDTKRKSEESGLNKTRSMYRQIMEDQVAQIHSKIIVHSSFVKKFFLC